MDIKDENNLIVRDSTGLIMDLRSSSTQSRSPTPSLQESSLKRKKSETIPITPKKYSKKSHDATPMTAHIVPTPPTTPLALRQVQKAGELSSTSILITDSFNPLSINRFKGITPVLTALNGGPLRLSFPNTEDSETFVVTGLLKEHNMAVVKDATEVHTQLQSKSTMTLSFLDSRTYSTCIGDQLTAIDDWIRIQPGFVLAQDKVFRSPYDEGSFTIDLTWPQYERQTSPFSTARNPQRREPLKMAKKDRLLPVRYNGDIEIEMQWSSVEVNSILRAVVDIAPYKDNKNKAYAGWTMNVSSMMLLYTPIGDLWVDSDPFLATDMRNVDLKEKNRQRLRF